jgi:FkbM family methyltransferase
MRRRGCQLGYFTLAAAHAVGSRGRVIGVEADPVACATLRANVARNRLGHVTVLEMAASDRRGEIWQQQYCAEASDSGNFGLASTNVDSNGRRVRVTARLLDEALDELGVNRVDLLKMDIEGDEGRALAGLCRRLGTHRLPRILLELHPYHLKRQGRSAEEVIEGLRRYGYEAWLIDHSPSVTRLVAAGRMDAASTLSRLLDTSQLGIWPHVLFACETRRPLFGSETPRRPTVRVPSATRLGQVVRRHEVGDADKRV